MIMQMLEIPWLLVLLIMALCGFTVFLFLPSILELKRPRNHGPRRILKDQIKGIDATVIGAPRLEIPFFAKGYIPENLQQTIMSLDGKKISKIDADTTKIDISVGKNTVINGSLNAKGSVQLGPNALVRLSLFSGRNVELSQGAKVTKNIISGGFIVSHKNLKP